MNLHFLLKALFLLLLTGCQAQAEPKSPALIWTMDEGLVAPESAYYDAKSKAIYVSNMNSANPVNRSGSGYITKLSPDGKVLAPYWAEGLLTPKGLRAHGGYLWVAAVDEVVALQIGKSKTHRDGELVKRIPIPGAKCLNDLTVAEDGTIYVSDAFANRIYTIRNGRVSVLAEGDDLDSPNGLLLTDGKLVIVNSALAKPGKPAGKGNLFALDLVTRARTLISKQAIGQLDGVEMDGLGNYVVSDWASSALYRVTPDGKTTLLLQEAGNTADFSFSPDKKTLYVPFLESQVVRAYDYGKLLRLNP